MEEKTITSFESLQNEFRQFIFSRNYIYRGVNNATYQLIPKIGRKIYLDKLDPKLDINDALLNLENDLWDSFVKMSIPFENLRDLSPWESLATAQHYGIPTRYLDWSQNPLVATYFSIENAKSDSAIYITDSTQFNANVLDFEDPFSITDDIMLYRPPYINQRIIAQKGLFTVHKMPNIPLENINIHDKPIMITKLILKYECHEEILKILNSYGINRSFIYPGLDGLATYLDFKAQRGWDI